MVLEKKIQSKNKLNLGDFMKMNVSDIRSNNTFLQMEKDRVN